MKQVKLNHKTSLASHSVQSVVDTLAQLQGAYMVKNGIETPPVRRPAIRKYARKFMTQLRRTLALCKTEQDYAKLHHAVQSTFMRIKAISFS